MFVLKPFMLLLNARASLAIMLQLSLTITLQLCSHLAIIKSRVLVAAAVPSTSRSCCNSLFVRLFLRPHSWQSWNRKCSSPPPFSSVLAGRHYHPRSSLSAPCLRKETGIRARPSVGSASALVTIMCVLFRAAPWVVRVL
jgi:hypothetical protein